MGAYSVVSKDIPDNVMCILPRKEYWVNKGSGDTGSVKATLEEFIDEFRGQFDDLDAVKIDADKKFHDLDDWSSLVAFSIISMINEKYGAKLTGDQLRTMVTVRDVFKRITA